MLCKNMRDGYCEKGYVQCKVEDEEFNSQIDCPYNGDTQKCLDSLIEENKGGRLWKHLVEGKYVYQVQFGSENLFQKAREAETKLWQNGLIDKETLHSRTGDPSKHKSVRNEAEE